MSNNRWTMSDIERKGLSKNAQKGISANTLTKHALKIFDLCGFNVWRQNNAAVYDATKKVYRANSSTKGISDIIGYNRKTGVFLACEIKVGKDRLSKEQELFLKGVKDSGGVAMVVKTIQDLEEFLKLNRWQK